MKPFDHFFRYYNVIMQEVWDDKIFTLGYRAAVMLANRVTGNYSLSLCLAAAAPVPLSRNRGGWRFRADQGHHHPTRPYPGRRN